MTGYDILQILHPKKGYELVEFSGISGQIEKKFVKFAFGWYN